MEKKKNDKPFVEFKTQSTVTTWLIAFLLIILGVLYVFDKFLN